MSSEEELFENVQQERIKDFRCVDDGCEKTGFQYADICVPVTLRPDIIVGRVETECCGEPEISCTAAEAKNAVEISICQRVSIKIPLHYSVEACAGEGKIECGTCGCI